MRSGMNPAAVLWSQAAVKEDASATHAQNRIMLLCYHMFYNVLVCFLVKRGLQLYFVLAKGFSERKSSWFEGSVVRTNQSSVSPGFKIHLKTLYKKNNLLSQFKLGVFFLSFFFSIVKQNEKPNCFTSTHPEFSISLFQCDYVIHSETK